MESAAMLQDDLSTDKTSMQHIVHLVTPSLYQQAQLHKPNLCSVPEGAFLEEKVPDRERV